MQHRLETAGTSKHLFSDDICSICYQETGSDVREHFLNILKIHFPSQANLVEHSL